MTTLTEHDVTPERIYRQRRDLLKALGFGLAASVVPWPVMSAATPHNLSFARSRHGRELELTDEYSITHYNNFYEFGLGKDDPAKNAKHFKTEPWSVVIDGEVAKPGRYNLEDIIKGMPLEERIYRMRCVEAWSMVIPWVGFPLAKLLERVQPNGKAKFVAFETLHDPGQMPGQKPGLFGFSSLDWPYVEGLRLDEAMHPLTILALGLYGKTLPPQNGAPLRLVVPWKYGFKGIKSIVRITLTGKQPPTTWNRSAPQEYGFYANVNPEVDHPRWSQARERRILNDSLFGASRIDTLPFNGYATEVAHLYQGMDLRRYY